MIEISLEGLQWLGYASMGKIMAYFLFGAAFIMLLLLEVQQAIFKKRLALVAFICSGLAFGGLTTSWMADQKAHEILEERVSATGAAADSIPPKAYDAMLDQIATAGARPKASYQDTYFVEVTTTSARLTPGEKYEGLVESLTSNSPAKDRKRALALAAKVEPLTVIDLPQEESVKAPLLWALAMLTVFITVLPNWNIEPARRQMAAGLGLAISVFGWLALDADTQKTIEASQAEMAAAYPTESKSVQDFAARTTTSRPFFTAAGLALRVEDQVKWYSYDSLLTAGKAKKEAAGAKESDAAAAEGVS